MLGSRCPLGRQQASRTQCPTHWSHAGPRDLKIIVCQSSQRHIHSHQQRLAAAQIAGSPSSSMDASMASTMESSVDEATKVSKAEVLMSLNIAEVRPEQLFDSVHIESWSPQLAAYFPLGCLLATIRFAAWVAGIAIDAPWFRNMPVVNAYMSLLGAKVTWKNTHNIPQDARHVLVSNHISVGDLLVLFQQPQRYVHLITSALPPQVYATEHLPAILQPANKETYLAIAAAQQIRLEDQTAAQQSHAAPFQHLGLLGSAVAATTTTSGIRSTSSSSDDSQLGRSSSNGSRSSEEQQAAVGGAAAAALAAAASCRAAIAAVKDAPVHVFPEGGMTNGSGMMRFSRGFMLFADKLPVVPVALRVKTAFPEVKSHTLTSPFLANLFWFSFQPWTEIEAVALPPMQLQPGESKAAFVQRVQLAIAEELGVWVTDMNIQQKRSLMQKRQRQQQKRRARR